MIADPAGWPDPTRPGVPLNQERGGWHWLHHPENLRPIPAMWNAELQGWTCGSLHSPGGIVELGYRYLGPCLTPADLAAERAAAAEITPEERATLSGLRDGTLVAVPREQDIWVLAYILRLPGEEGEWPQVQHKAFATEQEARADNAAKRNAYQVCRVRLAAAPEAPGRGDKP